MADTIMGEPQIDLATELRSRAEGQLKKKNTSLADTFNRAADAIDGTLVRETYDENLYGAEGRILDEVVATGARVHVERLSKRNWMCIIDVSGETIHLQMRDVNVYERITPEEWAEIHAADARRRALSPDSERLTHD